MAKPKSRAAELVGHAIRAFRVQAGLSLSDLASLTGSSAPVLCRYESGEHEPPFELLIAIADACDTTPSTILSVLDDELRLASPPPPTPHRAAGRR